MIEKEENTFAYIISGEEALKQTLNTAEFKTVYALIKEAKERLEKILSRDPEDTASDASPIGRALARMYDDVVAKYNATEEFDASEENIRNILYTSFLFNLNYMALDFPDEWGRLEMIACYKAFRDAAINRFSVLSKCRNELSEAVQEIIDDIGVKEEDLKDE